MPADLNARFQARHLRNIAKASAAIRLIYEGSITEVCLVAALLQYRGGVFSMDKYPLLKKKVLEVLQRMHTDITVTVVNSMKESWDLSNEKNDAFVDKRLAGKEPLPGRAQTLYDPNLKARDAFITRKDKGLNLSGRVWNTLDNFATEMEMAIGVHINGIQAAGRELAIGIGEGVSAASMAREIKGYLVHPDKLFRRVRAVKGDKTSKLKLSKAAQNFHPGRGVYRSSIRNAERLARTETQLAYQNADADRWARLPFVKGIDVRLSNRHKVYDVCNETAGLHPPDYRFVVRHPNCLCSCIPVLVSNEEYSKMEDYTLGLTDTPPQIAKIDTIPDAEVKWMKDNAERVKGWKSTPIFIEQNPKYLGKFLENK